MRTVSIVILLFILLGSSGNAQVLDSINFLDGIEEGNDTIPHKEIDQVMVFPKKKFKSKRYERRYWRLANRIKKVYPYAQKAAELLEKYEVEYLASTKQGKKRKYIKQVEKDLFEQYGSQLKKLSISEGRLLIKLIDRETGHTSYALIKDLKGGLSVFFWQGIARLFGNNLKDEYDPITEDKLIEEIIFYIEAGLI